MWPSASRRTNPPVRPDVSPTVTSGATSAIGWRNASRASTWTRTIPKEASEGRATARATVGPPRVTGADAHRDQECSQRCCGSQGAGGHDGQGVIKSKKAQGGEDLAINQHPGQAIRGHVLATHHHHPDSDDVDRMPYGAKPYSRAGGVAELVTGRLDGVLLTMPCWQAGRRSHGPAGRPQDSGVLTRPSASLAGRISAVHSPRP
uniref:Uncharacterized protein n=1 Tax=Salinispora arenicola (strain CNS-205) TaxID=391037 RepID=A8LWQ3_SALAI